VWKKPLLFVIVGGGFEGVWVVYGGFPWWREVLYVREMELATAIGRHLAVQPRNGDEYTAQTVQKHMRSMRYTWHS
jgi:hypothetical protein